MDLDRHSTEAERDVPEPAPDVLDKGGPWKRGARAPIDGGKRQAGWRGRLKAGPGSPVLLSKGTEMPSLHTSFPGAFVKHF